MIDREAVCADIHRWQAELQAIEAKRESIQLVLRGLRGWLDGQPEMHRRAQSDVQPTTKAGAQVQRARRIPKDGRPSVRGAIKQVLIEGQGRPLHTDEILAAVTALGITINSPRPGGLVELNLHSLRRDGHPIEKVATHTWMWDVQSELPASDRSRLEETTTESAHSPATAGLG